MTRSGAKLELSNSPLSLVLCQVRFSPLPGMGEFIPSFHRSIRRQFPVNASGIIQEVQFGGASPQLSMKERWEFLTRDRRTSVVVDNGFVVMQTTLYKDFETFLEQFVSVVADLNAAVGDLLIQRVGLRYVDAIVPRNGDSWTQYVQKELRGFESPVFAEEGALRLHQTVANTSVGTMLVRLHQNYDGAVLPPDLAGGHIKPGLDATRGQLTTLLDIDHFHVVEDGVDLPNMKLEEILWELKTGTFSIFSDHLVTEHALKVWQ
jgi:uncharacterized protein (TIGR04255 family)